ncbi:hypothetical protein F5887DRAFT_971734, partial [Amanita rubescens]
MTLLRVSRNGCWNVSQGRGEEPQKVLRFNLDDEDELTHYGQSLSNLDDFDDVGL